MALLMNDEQRLKALEAYNPTEHLISVGQNKDRTPVLYYPAAWRLYELRLRHPHFTLECEIVHMDEEKGTVIVKAIGYDGLDYASSNLKGTALKQGKVNELDKVETKAMSRVARNIGIGTEYALDFDDEDTSSTTPQGNSGRSQNATSNHTNNQNATTGAASQSNNKAQQNTTNLSDIPTVQKLRESAKTLNLTWDTVIAEAFERPINQGKITKDALIAKGDELSPESCQRIAAYLQTKQAA
jgi:hypothetical protein